MFGMFSLLLQCVVITLVLRTTAAGQVSFKQAYDFIIVGGGTAGLVIANRLSEIANITVLVIEAGGSALNNFNSSNVDIYGTKTDLDWAYKTVPQKYTGRYSQEGLPSGKGIGGSSLINGMVYTRAEASQIDAWEGLGNAGWNFASLFHYYKKSENLQVPGLRQIQGGATYDLEYHGFGGPVDTGWPLTLQVNDFQPKAAAAFASLGVPTSLDVNGGHMRDFYIMPKEITTTNDTRADAGRSYYYPVQDRANLFMMDNTLGLRLICDQDSPGEATAIGVEAKSSDGTRHNITARMEVVVSCGSYRSPPFLELSGVGNPRILSQYNISVKVNSPSVGENLMDQTWNHLQFEAKANENYIGIADPIAFLNVTDLFGTSAQAFGTEIYDSLPNYAAQIAAQNNGAVDETTLLELMQIQHRLIFQEQIPMMEFYPSPSKGSKVTPGGHSVLGCQLWTLLPFARGNVHIQSADSIAYPAINSNFWMFDYDYRTQAAGARYIRKLFSTVPLSDITVQEFVPGLQNVADDASDEEWAIWFKGSFRTSYHPVGTCIMLPQAMGGVVSDRAKVYGTANVRVVDTSIFPFQVDGHPSSTVYAVAEKIADLMKQDHDWSID